MSRSKKASANTNAPETSQEKIVYFDHLPSVQCASGFAMTPVMIIRKAA